MALGMEAFCRLRYYPTIYYIFFVPWILIAAALLTDALLRHVRSGNGSRDRAARNLVPVALAAAAILISGLWLNQALAARYWEIPSAGTCISQNYLPRLPGYFNKYCATE